MNKILLSLLCLLASQLCNAQSFEDYFYYEGEFAGMGTIETSDEDSDKKAFVFTGINFRGGFGVHDPDEFIFLGISTGMDGIVKWDIGIHPVYINSKMAIPLGDSTRLILAFGYGKSFQMGPERLNGFLRKYTIALGSVTKSENLQSIFFEVNNYGFKHPNGFNGVTANLGYSYSFL